MKKILLFIAIFAVSLNMQAQEKMFVWQNGAKTDFVVTDVDSITFNQLMANGHEYVDLGLPSGTLWATCNVGANKPEEYGDYFAWGETEPKSTYTKANYKWFSNGDDHNITKYNYDSSYGIVDNNNTMWYLGADAYLSGVSTEAGTGASADDRNGYTVTIEGTSAYLPFKFTGTITPADPPTEE